MQVRSAVIPAAGMGTRFLPATKAVPKEMLPLVDTPSIQLIVEECVGAGIEEIILVTARGKSAIEDHFDRAAELESLLEKRGKTADLALVRRPTEMAPH
jgi:UTP--glucose-1-phosphate uridylyltransferase